jgi:serine protease
MPVKQSKGLSFRWTLYRKGITAACLIALGMGGAVAQSDDRDGGFAPPRDDIRIEVGDPTEPVTRFIVHYREGSATRQPSILASELGRVGAAIGREVAHVRQLATGAELVEVEGRPLSGARAFEVMEAFAKNADVVYVEPDATMRVLQFTPNDTRYAEQWHYQNVTAGMRLPSAWSISTGSGITVAILDTGRTPHPDLDGNTVAGYDFVSSATGARDGNGRDSNPNDEGDWVTAGQCGTNPASNSSWHGTHVAGTVAAVTNNGTGVAGVAFGSRIQHIRVLAACGGSLSDIADGIVWSAGGTVTGIPANATPSRVINMSLGGGGACGSTYQAAIDAAVARGAAVVVAAGNSNVDAVNARPANCNNVITVAASDRNGNRAFYSNFGTRIDVTAPGGDTRTAGHGVLSTLNSGTTTQGSASYAFYQGTSMATPHVAGLAAMMLSRNSALTPAQVETLLKNNVRPLPGTCSGGCGAGLVDATATMQAVAGPANQAPVANFSFTTSGLTANFTDGSSDPDGTIASRSWNFGDSTTSTATSPSKTYAAAGTYTVTLTVTDNQGATNSSSRSVTVTNPTTQPSFFENLADFQIRDFQTTNSPISVTGRTGNAPSTLRVNVRIIHTYIGDLRVRLIAPNGTAWTLHNRTGAGTDNIITSYTVNASAVVANGSWRLEVNDAASGDVGFIDSWSLQF